MTIMAIVQHFRFRAVVLLSSAVACTGPSDAGGLYSPGASPGVDPLLGVRAAALVDTMVLAPAITTTSREYHPNGLLAAVTVDGVATRFSYAADGTLATRTTARGETTVYSEYKCNIPQREERPEGVVIQRVVNDLGFVVAETDGEGHSTLFERDGLGRATQVTYPRPGAATTQTVYGTARRDITRGERVERTTLDGFGRVTSHSPASGAASGTVYFGYDALGRTAFESFEEAYSPGGNSKGTYYHYDALDRLTQVVHEDGTARRQHYPGGPLPQVTTLNERNEVQTRWLRALVDPRGEEVMRIDATLPESSLRIERNVRGQMTRVEQSSLVRAYHYDEHFYLVGAAHPETGETRIGRDISGNMVSLSVGGSAPISFEFDGLERLVATRYADQTLDAYQIWDRNDRLLSVSTDGAERAWSYDEDGNVTEDRLTVGERRFVTRFNFDQHDFTASMQYPSGATIEFHPDQNGLPQTVGAYARDIRRTAEGKLERVAYGNGIESLVQFDVRQRPRVLTASRRSDVGDVERWLDMEITYDPVGNLTSVVDRANPANDRIYGYDVLDRLVSVRDGSGQTDAISYDGVGNITQRGAAAPTSFEYDASNRLVATTGAKAQTFSYDARGNITSNGTNTFEYDERSRLRCIDCGAPGEVRYLYDGAGVRVARTQSGRTVYEVHEPSGNLIAEIADDGEYQEHFYLDDRRIATDASHWAGVEGTVFYHTDLTGSPLVATDGDGNLFWRESYLPYGERVLRPNTTNEQWFHGKITEPETGIADFGARSYDPALGRFLSIDPVDFLEDNVHSFNRYAYGNNNPVRYRDRDGRLPSDTLPIDYPVPNSTACSADGGSCTTRVYQERLVPTERELEVDWKSINWDDPALAKTSIGIPEVVSGGSPLARWIKAFLHIPDALKIESVEQAGTLLQEFRIARQYYEVTLVNSREKSRTPTEYVSTNYSRLVSVTAPAPVARVQIQSCVGPLCAEWR